MWFYNLSMNCFQIRIIERMATHCGRTDYWLISYLDYDNYKDYDDFDKDYDDNYDDYDGDYDVLNLTQLLMHNSHSLLLSCFVQLSE